MPGFYIKRDKLPIVFSPDYNVTFCGLQCIYPYDTEKGQHVLHYLILAKALTEDKLTKPLEISEDDLLEIHSPQYLDSLKISETVSRISEIPLLSFIPNLLVQNSYLRPMRYQTGGSLRAAKLALREGWAINLGGGFSHCTCDEGGSFSPYSDITLIVRHLLLNERSILNVMIIDLSARQGNGYERDLIDVKNLYIMDMFNSTIYPKDELAKVAINRQIPLPSKTEDEVYLRKLRIYLKKALDDFWPSFIIYIAGTDILEGDALGELSVSPEGIIARDELVFTKAITNKIPIVMLLGTGFKQESAKIIANSIINLKDKNLLPSDNWPTTIDEMT